VGGSTRITLAQIILGLLTITMSGVVSAVVTYKLNLNRDERRFRRQRLEEAFIAFMGFTKELGIHWMRFVPVMTGKLTYDQALDSVIAAKVEASHFDNLEMLLTLYWPELLTYYNRLIGIRQKGNDVLVSHKRRYLSGLSQDRESFDAMQALLNEVGQLERDFSAAAKGFAVMHQGVG